MIGTVFQIALLRLWNNKLELMLALVVPVVFFSIFAMIFGRGVASGTPTIKVAIVDDDRSRFAEEVVRLLKDEPAVAIDLAVLQTSATWPLDRLAAAVLQETRTDVVIHLPAGVERSVQSQRPTTVRLLSDGTNPVARQLVNAMLAQSVGVALAESRRHERLGDHTVSQPVAPTYYASRFDTASPNPGAAPTTSRLPPLDRVSDRITFATTDLFAADKNNPKIAMYAAGIAVMFLLFSATGAGGSLLEEYEAGTLDRLLSSRLSVTELLAGKWLYITCLGCVQLTVMFLWAQFAFGVDLGGHLPGFVLITLCTAAATASLAICLAVVCRTRAELNGVSIVLILTMSALGGSMVPRYIMSEEMQRWGRLTFNAWALDGFKKVFWYDLPVTAMATEVQVLLVMAFALGSIAWLFAERWAAK